MGDSLAPQLPHTPVDSLTCEWDDILHNKFEAQLPTSYSWMVHVNWSKSQSPRAISFYYFSPCVRFSFTNKFSVLEWKR